MTRVPYIWYFYFLLRQIIHTCPLAEPRKCLEHLAQVTKTRQVIIESTDTRSRLSLPDALSVLPTTPW